MYRGATTLTNNRQTKVSRINDDIKAGNMSIESAVNTVSFPPDNILSLNRKFFCQNCSKYCQNVNDPSDTLFNWENCSAQGLTSKIQQQVFVKLLFEDPNNSKKITVFVTGAQIDGYFNQSMPTVDSDLIFGLLQDNITTLIYDKRYNCIGLDSSNQPP